MTPRKQKTRSYRFEIRLRDGMHVRLQAAVNATGLRPTAIAQTGDRYTANLPKDAGRATDGRAESGPCCSTSPKTKAEETDFRCHAKAYQGKTGLMMPSCPVQLRLLIVHPEIANAYQAATHATTEIHDA